MGKKFKYDVFLSHNSADKAAIKEVASRLRAEKIEPWLDRWNLIPGEPWQETIEEALFQCKTCAIFVGPSGLGPWQNEEMRAAIDRRIKNEDKRFRVIPVLLPGGRRDERSRLPSFLVATTWVEFRETLDEEEAFHQFVCGIRGIEPGHLLSEQKYKGICPYRGLRRFEVEHAPFFFGREALTDWLLHELRSASGVPENHFLAILGPSGSGKSSIARAGLIPALMQNKLEGSQDWPIIILRPGANPVESLAVALSADPVIGKKIPSVRTFLFDLYEDQRTLHLTIRSALYSTPEDMRTVVLVDQFEEIFTLCQDESLRLALLNNLLYASSVVQGQTIIMLTMRADFYAKCAPYNTLSAALSDHQVLVGPMTEDELSLAIKRPAQLVGCEFEQGLVQTLLQDVEDQAGALPLLQHTLTELWERREGRQLTHAAYKTIGKLVGALERHANEILGGFSRLQQEICRRIFLRLTQLGEGTEDVKRRASFKELLPADGNVANVSQVIQTLADQRLVTTEGEKDQPEARFVEIAHEALIQNWPTLRQWIDSDREALRIHRRLSDAATEWDTHDHDQSYLYRGVRLTEANEWLNTHFKVLNPVEQSFLQASADLRKTELEAEKLHHKKLHHRAIALSIAGAIATVLGIVVLILYCIAQVAREEERQARITAQTNEAKANQATREATKNLYIARMRLAPQCWEAGHIKMLKNMLEDYIPEHEPEDLRGWEWYYLLSLCHKDLLTLRGHTAQIKSVVWSPNGQFIASGSNDGTVKLWDVKTGRMERSIPQDGRITAVAWSLDSRRLASASTNGTADVYDAATGKLLIKLLGHMGSVNAIAWSMDGQLIATGSSDYKVIVWDSKTGKESLRFGLHKSIVNCVAWSPDRQSIASGDNEGYLIIWDARTGKEFCRMRPLDHDLYSIEWSPDGHWLVSTGYLHPVIIWDARTGEKKQSIPQTAGAEEVTWSPDSKTIASATRSQVVELWERETQKKVSTIRGHEGWVNSVTFSPDGNQLASGGDDCTIKIWDTRTDQLAIVLEHPNVSSVAWSSKANILASAGGGRIRLIELESRTTKELFSLDLSEDPTVITWDNKGKRVVAGRWGDKGNSTIVWDSKTAKEIMNIPKGTNPVLSPDGERLAVSIDREVQIWDLSTKTISFTLPKHEERVFSLSWSPDGQRLASGDWGNIRISDGATGRPITNLKGHAWGKWIGALSWSPNGIYLASGGWDQKIMVWDLEKGNTLQILNGHTGAIFSLKWSRDGRRIASGSQDQTAKVWDFQTGQELMTLKGHTDSVRSVSWSQNDRKLATASQDGTVRIWDASEGYDIASGHRTRNPNYLEISPTLIEDLESKEPSAQLAAVENLIEKGAFPEPEDFRKFCRNVAEAASQSPDMALSVHKVLVQYLSHKQLKKEDLDCLKDLPSPYSFNLSKMSITDTGMPYIGNLSSLRCLWLRNTEITDEGLAHLRNLTSLEELYLENTMISDEGLAHLKELTSLKALFLGSTQVTDLGLLHIENLSKLEAFCVHDTQVTNAGLSHLKDLINLEYLCVHHTEVSDAGLKYLKKLTALRRLYLNNTQVTDEGLTFLKDLRSLQKLALEGTQVTIKGINELRETLPFTDIPGLQFRKFQEDRTPERPR